MNHNGVMGCSYYKMDFSSGKVYCGNCNILIKNHVDDALAGKVSNWNEECLKCVSIFMGNNWGIYDKVKGTIGIYMKRKERKRRKENEPKS